MAVSVSDIRTRFIEFASNPPDAFITACIIDATAMVDSAVYGDKSDMAIRYLTAHLIATNPLGEMGRMDSIGREGGRETDYLAMFETIKKSIGAGFRVI